MKNTGCCRVHSVENRTVMNDKYIYVYVYAAMYILVPRAENREYPILSFSLSADNYSLVLFRINICYKSSSFCPSRMEQTNVVEIPHATLNNAGTASPTTSHPTPLRKNLNVTHYALFYIYTHKTQIMKCEQTAQRPHYFTLLAQPRSVGTKFSGRPPQRYTVARFRSEVLCQNL